MDKKPDVIDAEFEVIEPAQPKPRWPWDYRFYIDWRVFAVIAATSLAGLLQTLMK